MWQLLLTHTPLLYFVQSVWRDEAFSILVAQHPISFIFTRLGFEPPVYYLLLHYWMRLFGTSEIATRSLSFMGFIGATIIIVTWSEQLFKKHWLSFFLPVFFFFNPMLLYYAFEVRTYGWYMFFATASLYSYTQQKWKWFVIASLLGFYTHTYFLLFLLPIGLHWLLTAEKQRKLTLRTLQTHVATKSFAIIGIGMLPWIIKVIYESSRLKNSWYFPVNMQLVRSVLGNMFIGYEGTPWYGWHYTPYLSLILIGFGYLALIHKARYKQNILFILYATLPLVICVGISFIKPLFVNRYLIPTTIALVLMVGVALQNIRSGILQKIVALGCLLFVVWFNWWYPPLHAKLPIRDTMTQINSLRKGDDSIIAESSLIYLETKYYAENASGVYLYNPNNAPFPWYVGDAVVTSSDMIRDYPAYPSRAFLIHENGTYDIVYRMPIIQTSSPTTQ